MNRNQQWFGQIKSRLEGQGKPVFVRVGIGHLVGPHNLHVLKENLATTMILIPTMTAQKVRA